MAPPHAAPQRITMTSGVACPRAFARSLHTFHAARLLQPVVPTSTGLAAPLLVQSDLIRGGFDEVLLALHGARV
jgi:hypothetical protein